MTRQRKEIVAAACVVVALTAGAMYFRHKNEQDQARIEQIRSVARADATARVLDQFHRFQRSQEEKGTIVQWMGVDSKVLWLQYTAAHEESSYRSGTKEIPEHWTVWAQSKKGRLFVLDYYLLDDGNFYTENTIREPDHASLVRRLIDAGEIEKAKELGIPVNGA